MIRSSGQPWGRRGGNDNDRPTVRDVHRATVARQLDWGADLCELWPDSHPSEARSGENGGACADHPSPKTGNAVTATTT